MFIVNSIGLAIFFCVITMLGWGSWANTQKLAGMDHWPFPLFYWDYAVGVFALGILMMVTLGIAGTRGVDSFANLAAAGAGPITQAFLSGALFNVSNILLVVAIVACDLSAIDDDITDLALVRVVEELRETDVLLLASASCFDDYLPEKDKAGDHEDPDQNLFDGRVQSEFPHFPACSAQEPHWLLSDPGCRT